MGRYISNINTNSYQDNELLLLRQGIAKNHKEFLTAGTNTWTIDHDVIVRVRVWGGGGGGGSGLTSSAANAIPGAGGGAGGAAEAILKLNAGTYNITVGAGGAGATGPGSQVGGNGGASSFHTYITCSGGLGGNGGRSHPVFGGAGGAASFDLSGFGGFLYMDGRFGGAGGSVKTWIAVPSNADGTNGAISYRISLGSEEGAGESGGPSYYAYPNGGTFTTSIATGGGGGGYNPPFIYVTNVSAQFNSGRGVGTGGAGGYYEKNGVGYIGNSGAVVIEWN